MEQPTAYCEQCERTHGTAWYDGFYIVPRMHYLHMLSAVEMLYEKCKASEKEGIDREECADWKDILAGVLYVNLGKERFAALERGEVVYTNTLYGRFIKSNTEPRKGEE